MTNLLVIVKPWVIHYTDEILGAFDSRGRRIRDARVDSVPQRIIEAHYAVHRDKPFFGPMTREFIGQPVHLAVYGGDCAGFRQAAIGVRERYAPEIPPSENRLVFRNAVHVSDPEEAARELEVWRDYLK